MTGTRHHSQISMQPMNHHAVAVMLKKSIPALMEELLSVVTASVFTANTLLETTL